MKRISRVNSSLVEPQRNETRCQTGVQCVTLENMAVAKNKVATKSTIQVFANDDWLRDKAWRTMYKKRAA